MCGDLHLVLEAARLVDEYTALAEAREKDRADAHALGYEMGYQTGLEAGYKAAENEMAEIWTKVSDSAQAAARQKRPGT